MGIEQDIKSKKFKNEYQKLAINLLFTSSWLDNLNTQWLKPYDISPQQFNVLRILRGSHPNPLMLGDISSRMIDRMSNATRLVEKLRQKGLAERRICEHNRRQVDITITEKGLKLLKKIDEISDSWDGAFKNISKKDAAFMNELLDKMRE